MSAAKHTPGPLVVVDRSGPNFHIVPASKPGQPIPVAWVAKLADGRANADLLAAAPELAARLANRLESCRNHSGCGSRDGAGECRFCIDDRAALRKAGVLP